MRWRSYKSLFLQNGAFTAQRYLDEFVQAIVLPYAVAGKQILDNACSHRTDIINWLDDVRIMRVELPIEYAWDAFGRRVAARNMSPRTISDKKWDAIP